MNLNEKVIEHIKCSHAALDTAKVELEKAAAAKAAAEALIPAAVEALIQHARIDPNDREKAAALLRDPAGALTLLIKTADVSRTVAPRAIGSPQQAPSTTATAPRPRYTGEKGSEKTAAAIAFEEKILGPR